MKTEILAQVLVFVVNSTGLPAIPSEELPNVVPMTTEQMTTFGCETFYTTPDTCEYWKKEAPQIQAMFVPSTYTIYYQTKYDFEYPLAQSYLAHEITHVLQFKANVLKTDTCDGLFATELLAYRVQDMYLGNNRPVFAKLFQRQFRCQDKETN